MKYLLPCACGRQHVIDVGQAGQRIVCECGQTLEAPTMRGIKALAPAVEANANAPPPRETRAWSSTQGTLFALGVLMAVAGLIGAGYCIYVVRLIDYPPPPAEFIAARNAEFEKLTVDQLYDVFTLVKKEGLGTAEPPDYVKAQRAEALYTRYGMAAGAVAGVGLLLALGAFLWPSPSPSSRPK